MDSCITFASAYLIPLMLPSYTHGRLPRFTVSFYIWHYVELEKLINMLYRNRNLFVFFFFLLNFLNSSHGVERNTCTQLDLQVAQFKIMSCCFVTKWKCFYLWSLRHIIVLILSHATCTSKTKVFLFSLCLFPFKRYCCIAIAVTCTGFLYFDPLHLLLSSSKCLTILKGLPRIWCPAIIKDTGYRQLCKRFIVTEFYLIVQLIYVKAEGERKTPENHTQRSGLLTAAQPVKKRGRAQSLYLF